MKSIRIKVGETRQSQIGEAQIKIYRKTKYVYQILDLENNLIAKGESLPKATQKAEAILERKSKKTKKAEKSPSIKSLTISMILTGREDDFIIKSIQESHPDSKFDKRHISWYRSTLYKDGVISAEHAPRNSRAHKSWKSNKEKV